MLSTSFPRLNLRRTAWPKNADLNISSVATGGRYTCDAHSALKLSRFGPSTGRSQFGPDKVHQCPWRARVLRRSRGSRPLAELVLERGWAAGSTKARMWKTNVIYGLATADCSVRFSARSRTRNLQHLRKVLSTDLTQEGRDR